MCVSLSLFLSCCYIYLYHLVSSHVDTQFAGSQTVRQTDRQGADNAREIFKLAKPSNLIKLSLNNFTSQG
uniref:Putative secreted protein n=1 Tax=Anopheles marajoara TaxID=58244 RepID=A0A2M4CEK1_9DIPT